MIATIEQPKVRWVQLTRERAKERWFSGDAITLIPCKCSPTGPSGLAVEVYPEGFMVEARSYGRHSPLWKGSVEETAWYLMYQEWAYSSTGFDLGAHANFYIAKPVRQGNETCQAG